MRKPHFFVEIFFYSIFQSIEILEHFTKMLQKDSSFTHSKKRKRTKFTPEEDNRLLQLYNYFQQKTQNRKHIFQLIADKMKKETRQVKERFENYISPTLSHAEWTDEEDLIISRMVEKIGKKFTKIAKLLKGRSGSEVKNRYYFHIQKQTDSNKPSIAKITSIDTNDGGMVLPIFDEFDFNKEYELFCDFP